MVIGQDNYSMLLPKDLSELQSLDHAERRQLPEVSAVYFVIGADEVIGAPAESVLYVGATQNLRKRFRTHTMNCLAKSRKSSSGWIIAWAEVSESERQALELACLLHWRPPYARDMYALPFERLADRAEDAQTENPQTAIDWRIENAAERRIKYGRS
jgi:hypothetical protein